MTKIIYGPILSPVYGDSIRVWVMMKASSSSADAYALEVSPESGGATLLATTYNSEDLLRRPFLN
ncbi:MAG: hypothetical protein H7282_09065 [Cytophagaceae bacterium]|nr:hypothetical protein [Cytophagaceae bacterium]